MIALERFSYSGLESYKKCPAQFKFRYIDFIRKPDEGIEAFMGKRVHEALEFYIEVQSGRIPIIDSIHDYYKSIWNDKWHNRIAIAKRGECKEDYFRLGEDCIARFYRKNQPFAERVEGIELEIDFKLDGNESYRIKGIIDRLDHDSNGKFEIHDYNDETYAEKLDRIRERFIPLIQICKEYGTAMRIGTNHGSLSDRIMSRYGDTPLGMVESAMEFLRIAEDEKYHDIILSMKASNTQVMVQAYRLLVKTIGA